MDRRGRLDVVRHVSAESSASDSRRRAAGGETIFQRRPEHDGLVRAGAFRSGEGLVIRLKTIQKCALLLALFASATAGASMADHSRRAQAAGIDVVTYPTGVKDVVVIVGVLPAGDAMAQSGNIAIPSIAGMMLDRGTKALDKFAIADRLDNVGASISFAVGVQSLELHGKCLKKDLPLVLGLIAAELRTPSLQAQEFAKAKQQFIGSLEASLQNTEGRAREAFGRTVFPGGHPNRPHSIAESLAAAKSATLDEVKAFHAKYYGPSHMTLIAVGDVAPAGVEAEVAKAFSGWTGGKTTVLPRPPGVP